MTAPGDHFTARLLGLGRLDWSEARSHLTGLTCAWADLDGWHEDAAPTSCPLATHLWAWGDGTWARLRLEGDEAIVALLSTTPDADGDEVSVRQRAAHRWDTTDLRLSPPARALGGGTVTLLEVETLTRLWFVDGRPNYPGD